MEQHGEIRQIRGDCETIVRLYEILHGGQTLQDMDTLSLSLCLSASQHQPLAHLSPKQLKNIG